MRRPRSFEEREARRRRIGVVAASVAVTALLTLGVIIGVSMSRSDDVLTMNDGFGRPHSERDRPTPTAGGQTRLLPERSVDDEDGFDVFRWTGHGGPVRYDPCRPIAVVVSAHLAPEGYVALVDSVIDEVSAASGLAFEIEDYATEEHADLDRSAFDPDRYGDRWSPVLIAWSNPAEFPPLDGWTAGVGGSVYAEDQTADVALRSYWYVSGSVVLDATQLGDDPAEHRTILLHELGHVLGLAHVDDPDEVMFPIVSDSNQALGAGDLAGFAATGAGDCAPAL